VCQFRSPSVVFSRQMDSWPVSDQNQSPLNEEWRPNFFGHRLSIHPIGNQKNLVVIRGHSIATWLVHGNIIRWQSIFFIRQIFWVPLVLGYPQFNLYKEVWILIFPPFSFQHV